MHCLYQCSCDYFLNPLYYWVMITGILVFSFDAKDTIISRFNSCNKARVAVLSCAFSFRFFPWDADNSHTDIMASWPPCKRYVLLLSKGWTKLSYWWFPLQVPKIAPRYLDSWPFVVPSIDSYFTNQAPIIWIGR